MNKTREYMIIIYYVIIVWNYISERGNEVPTVPTNKRGNNLE